MIKCRLRTKWLWVQIPLLSLKLKLLSATLNFIFVLLNILYRLLIKPLRYAQAFVFKTFRLVSPVLTSLSHENTIETSLKSKKYRLAKYYKVDA